DQVPNDRFVVLGGTNDQASKTPMFLWDVDCGSTEGRAVATGAHCFGCTASAGSSCGGATI
ncbi:MAG TPA: DUF3641 domain-containing protein, partial [Abditibacteriaceae bacterium]|nr:DUF3641 domain-containing protein [Abditibacteriaceae bacterium]